MRDQVVQLCSDARDLVTPAVQGTYINPPGKHFFSPSVDGKGTPPLKLRARIVEQSRQFSERLRLQGTKLQLSAVRISLETEKKNSRRISRQDYVRDKVEPLLRQNVGTEFPTSHHPQLVYPLFQDYSDEWPQLAQEHKDNAEAICSQFLGLVVELIWPHRMGERLRAKYLDRLTTGMFEAAQEELDKLARDRHFEVQPYDPEYEERINKWRADAPQGGPHSEAEGVLEDMLIYYELSAKTFITNVITQVIERHLLQGLLNIFSCVEINKLADESIEAIAAEDLKTRNHRIDLMAKKKAIDEARSLCANLRMHEKLRTDSNDKPEIEDDSLDEEESSTTLLDERLQTSPNPPQTARSEASTPQPLQRPPHHEERQLPPTVNGDAARNDFARSAGGLVVDNDSKAKVSRGISSDDLNGPGATKYDAWARRNPQHPPPTPPRPRQPSHQTESRYYPASPTGFNSRETLAMPGEFPDQPSGFGKKHYPHSSAHS